MDSVPESVAIAICHPHLFRLIRAYRSVRCARDGAVGAAVSRRTLRAPDESQSTCQWHTRGGAVRTSGRGVRTKGARAGPAEGAVGGETTGEAWPAPLPSDEIRRNAPCRTAPADADARALFATSCTADAWCDGVFYSTHASRGGAASAIAIAASASINENQRGDQRGESRIDAHEEPEQSIRSAIDHPEGLLAFATTESRSEVRQRRAIASSRDEAQTNVQAFAVGATSAHGISHRGRYTKAPSKVRARPVQGGCSSSLRHPRAARGPSAAHAPIW